MIKQNNQSVSQIPPEEYTREYYEQCCHGYEEFQTSHGEILPKRLIIPIELANIEPGIQVIDLGSGRGETVLNCAQRGAWVWGLDYSRDALKLSQEIFDRIVERDVRDRLAVQQANVTQLPFARDSVDVVIMLDIVEHLTSNELYHSLADVYRILQPGGRLIIHTMPSLWYYRFGYPLFRFFERLRGRNLPKDPRSRWSYSHVHINEQTIRSLKKSLVAAGFKTRVWLSTTQSYEHEKNPMIRSFMIYYLGLSISMDILQ
jgi:cyclopropane fatty-acyl-phospholipid synthase-like methyltransferase